jgi:hypothetical protein
MLFAAVHESVNGPSRQILAWNLMSAFGVLRTSCEAGHQANRSRLTQDGHYCHRSAETALGGASPKVDCGRLDTGI